MEASIRLGLRCGPRLQVLSRRGAIQFELDVANKFPSAVSMSSASPWRKAKSGMLQSALANREKQGRKGRGRGRQGARAEGMVSDAELCSQTFDRLALMSSTQSLL